MEDKSWRYRKFYQFNRIQEKENEGVCNKDDKRKHNVRVDTSSNMINYNCEKIYPLVQERDYWNE